MLTHQLSTTYVLNKIILGKVNSLKRSFYTLVAFMALFLTWQSILAGNLDGDYLHKVTMNYVTPHQKWADPLAAGKIKALFITPRKLASREVVELAQRLSLDYEVVVTHSWTQLASSDKYSAEIQGTSPKEKEEEILRKLRGQYDVIVFANFSYDTLSTKVKYKILRHVNEGTGLLFTYTNSKEKRLFKNVSSELGSYIFNLPWKAMEYFKHNGSIEAYQFGRGRIACVNYGQRGDPGLTPPVRGYSREWDQHYEYYLSLIAKTIIWASQKESGYALRIEKDGLSYTRKALPSNLLVKVDSNENESLRLLFTIRDKYGRSIFNNDILIEAAKGQVKREVRIPQLPAGEYYYEGILKNKDGILDWAAISFSVEDDFTISEIVYQEDSHQGEIILSKPALPRTKVKVSLVDNHGRILDEELYSVKEHETVCNFSLSLEGYSTKMAIVKVDLLNDIEVINSVEKDIFTGLQGSPAMFPSVIWDGYDDYAVSIIAKRQLKNIGFDAFLSHPEGNQTGQVAAAANIDMVPYMYRIFDEVNEDGWSIDQWLKRFERINIEDGVFANDQIKNAAKNVVERRMEGLPQIAPLVYSLGDENGFNYNGGFSPSQIEAYREFLKRKYGDIKTLNSVWNTAYPDWNFSVPTIDEMLNKKLYAARHDHMSFLEEQYALYHRVLAEHIRSIDPNAKVGAEGSEPGDIEKTLEGLDFWAPYLNFRMDAIIRSLRPDIMRGNWWGGYGSMRPGMEWLIQLWPQVLRGHANMSLIYMSYGVHGVLGSDLMPAKYFREIKNEYDEITQRIGPLLSNCQFNNDGVAIHYSIASEHLATMLPNSGSPKVEQTALINILDSLGIGYEFITTKQIETGSLLAGKYKVLFLNLSYALSKEEEFQLKEFIKAGGTVIADLNPGIADGNCKFNEDLNSSIFGVRFEEALVDRNTKIALDVKGLDNTLQIKNSSLNSALKVCNGTPMAYWNGTPCLVIQEIEEGQAILLNLSLSSFAEEPEALQLINYLLALSGINRKYSVVSEDKMVLKSFTCGSQELVTVYFPTNLVADWKLKLDEPKYVWDSRSGEYLGFGEEFNIPVYQNRQPAYVFAVQDYNNKNYNFDLVQSAQLGNTVQGKFSLTTCDVDFVILRLEVRNPDGEVFAPFTQTLKVDDKEKIDFRFALNDQKGIWKFKAIDVATGDEVIRHLEVR